MDPSHSRLSRIVNMTTPIPSPPAIPFLGHIHTLDRDLPIKSMHLLAQQYGEIYELNILGKRLRAMIIIGYTLTLSLLWQVENVSSSRRMRSSTSSQTRNAS